MHKCLQKKRAHRYPTARDLLQDTARLADVVAKLQRSTTAEKRSGPRIHKLIATVRDQWPLWVSGGALVVLITAGVFLDRQPVEPVPVSDGPSSRLSLPSPSPTGVSISKNHAQQQAPVRIDTQNGRFDVYQNGSR